MSAISTLIQLFPIGKKGGFAIGSGLPMIMGVSFAYVPSMQAIAEGYGVAAIFGAQIVGGIVALGNGASCPADPGVLPAADHGNGSIYHWSFSVSHRYKLYGRRNRKRGLRFLAELAGGVFYPGGCDGSEPFRQRNLQAGVHPDRNHCRIYCFHTVRYGEPFQCRGGGRFSASAVHAFRSGI